MAATPSLSTLERLADVLKKIIAAAELGDWEGVEALSKEFLVLQHDVLATTPPLHAAAAYRTKLKETLALQERAMALCQDRMTVIEPLVRALSSSSADTP